MIRVVLTVLVLLAGGTAVAAEPAKKPNVLFLMSDDMRPELGCYGHAIVKSPNIDALAKAGVRFDRAYCQYPLCNPSRASLLTGRHPTTTGVLDNTTYFRDAHPDWVTLPEHFKANGYATLRAGKIFHGGIDDQQSWTDGGEVRKKPGEVKKASPKERQKTSDRIVVLEGDGQSHGDYRTADRAIQFLRQYKDKPFFLACGFTKPHSPPTAPQKFFDLYDAAKIPLPKTFAAKPAAPEGFPERSITPNGDLFIGRDASEDEAKQMLEAYYASISWTDWNVGRVIAELDELGLRDNTVIVFWGDHGYHLGEFGKWAKHGSLFETGTRVPLVVAAPGAKAKGAVAPHPVQSLDIYPTLCELCGLKAPAGIEGHSLKPLLDDANVKWDHPAYSVAGNAKNLGVAVRTAKYRYAEWTGAKGGGAMLIDESADPHETKNLIDDPQLAAVREELSALAKKHATGGTK
jgi:iduronate 2-sulfatase